MTSYFLIRDIFLRNVNCGVVPEEIETYRIFDNYIRSVGSPEGVIIPFIECCQESSELL